MADFETVISDAVTAQVIPGCVLVSTNRDVGSFNYAKAFGNTSMKPENAKPLQLDTVMWVASCTKLMTSIACMQLVEQGLVSLDEPIYKHIPELESYTIIKGFEEGTGKPIEEKHTVPMTLKHLLTHSSGLTYDVFHPKTLAWLAYHKRKPNSSGKLLERFDTPLVAEPGESWAYGPSLDFVGLMVERISGMSLEDYLKKNVWGPVGINDVTFFPSTRPDMQARMADMTTRDAEGKLTHDSGRSLYHDGNGNEIVECLGGQGAFTSAGEYIKLLQGLLASDENEKLLKKETVELFFKPHLSAGSSAAMNAFLQDEAINNIMGSTPLNVKKDWGLGGILILADLETGKKSGAMIWGGLPNLLWWVDRNAGLCGLYAGQVLPLGDAKCMSLARTFEEGVYAKYKESRASRL
ncbi:beta-lactamase/transpeptidase-like protein [Phaeosphaeriaceae sp. PMI808]|nr:beta-lactamase/transpeptidase-like protein [Phaeosphaeriaceae sp. PMI808]